MNEVDSQRPKKNKMAEEKKYTLDWTDYYSHDVLNEVVKLIAGGKFENFRYTFNSRNFAPPPKKKYKIIYNFHGRENKNT